MPLEEAFLEDIRTHPEDDTPRLVYADWLDERGDADRAELIRVQCELAWPGVDQRRRAELERRQQGLLAAGEGGWAGPLEAWGCTWEFRRGFIEHVRIDATVFLSHAAALFAAAPVRSVELHQTAGVLPAVAASPYLARLSALDLGIERMGAGGAKALASSPHLTGLTTLLIGNSGVGNEGAAALANSPHL